MPQGADEYTRLLFQLFHEGIVEPWISETESVHLVLAGTATELAPAALGLDGALVSGGHPVSQGHAARGQLLD